MITWEDLKGVRIPIVQMLAAFAVMAGSIWGAFAWADTMEDKQVRTQEQLDQLILIVTTTTTKGDERDELQDDEIDMVEHAFELLRQEMELRRELGESDGPETQ